MLAISLSVAFTLGWILPLLFRAESTRQALPSYGAAERFWVLVAPLVLALHIAASCVLLSLRSQLSITRALFCTALYIGGIGFWLWARTAIGPLHVRRLPDEAPPKLRRDGAFGLVRNPLYFGTLVAAAAPALAAGRPVLALTFAASLIALAVRSFQEERRLRAQLGNEYESYQREVKRLVPFVW